MGWPKRERGTTSPPEASTRRQWRYGSSGKRTGRRCVRSTSRASPGGTRPSRPRLPTGRRGTARSSTAIGWWPSRAGGSSAGSRCTPSRCAPATAASSSTASTSPTTRRARESGGALLERLIADTEQAGIWTIQTGIFPENEASLALHQKCGFRVVGTQERLGHVSLDGVWRDVVVLERRSKEM